MCYEIFQNYEWHGDDDDGGGAGGVTLTLIIGNM
jgi:hypothetical protein